MSARRVTAKAQDGMLLLYCLGVGNGERPPAPTDADCEKVLRQAGDNGIIPLLYHRLATSVPVSPLPTEAVEYLRREAVRSAAQSLAIVRELSEILALFRRHGVMVIVLKGAHLGPLVYDSSALRTMGDLDLMVRREQLATTEALLGRLGYTPIHDPQEQVDYARHHHTRPLGKPGAARIDVHWSIARPTAPFDVSPDEIWQRAVPARIAGAEVLVLAPEDLLLHLCLHASFDHQFRLGLRACWDIREVILRHGETIDWDGVVRRAERWGIGRYVYATLRLVADLLAVRVPDAALARLEPRDFSPAVLAWARTCIFATESESALSPSMAKLWTSQRLATKLTVLGHTLAPSRAAMARIYKTPPGSPRIYLYYGLRWVDLLFRYGRRAWGLWRGDDRTHDELRAVSERAALEEWLGGAGGGLGARPPADRSTTSSAPS